MKIKEFLKSYCLGLVLGGILTGLVIVCAETFFPSNSVTYDNKESGLKSTDVQGAIDELYGVCTTKPAGEAIIEDAGLEKDPYECRYFFTGANPNNYITFNDEKAGWRIISVECDGSIKIMRINGIANQLLDGSDNWEAPINLNTYLNDDYLINTLNSISQNQIITKNWSIGEVKYDDTNLSNTVNSENSKKWKGKIALPTVSEYLRTNSNKNSCGTFYLNGNNNFACLNTGWMDIANVSYWWTLTPYLGNTATLYWIGDRGDIARNNAYACAVRPTLYLSPDIKITGGTGTESDPYTIE